MKKHPRTNKENGGCLLVDKTKDEGSLKILIESIKAIGKKFLNLQLLDILKFSRPAKITSPHSLHECCANEYLRTDLLEKAYQIKDDPVERIKYIFAFVISGIHKGPINSGMMAPFNPILGETFQASLDDGTELYAEQTEHHPPSFNYLIKGPKDHFKMFGFGTIVAHLSNLNKIDGYRDGKNMIRFDTGEIFSFSNLRTRINNLIMGDLTYNYYGDLIIKDYKNKIECICTFDDEQSQSKLSSLIFGKDTRQYDEGTVEIKKVNKTTQQKELLSKGRVSWLGNLNFDGKEYWNIFEPCPVWKQDNIKFLLESDSNKRKDLNAIKAGDYELAQTNKDLLENIQRKDQKLREENINKVNK